MVKGIAQAIAVALAFVLARQLELGPLVTVLLALAGVLLIQFIAVFLRNTQAGMTAISKDDPLMLDAREQAKQSWDDFLLLFAERPKDAVVKFGLLTAAGSTEFVWGDLIGLAGSGDALVMLKTPPRGGLLMPGEPRMTVPIADVMDWQVVMEDGTLRGGFTQQATFRIIQRDKGSLPPAYANELARYQTLERRARTPVGVWRTQSPIGLVSLEFEGGPVEGAYKQITETQNGPSREFGHWALSDGALRMLAMAIEDRDQPGIGLDDIYRIQHCGSDQMTLDGPRRAGMVFERAPAGTSVDLGVAEALESE